MIKKLCILLCLLICSTGIFAQFKLSGKINNYSGHGELKINIPLVYGFNDANSVNIPVAKNGAFSITLPIKQPRFADLVFQQTFHLLLLDAGKNLNIILTENDKSVAALTGTAAAENNLLQAVNLEEAPQFLQTEDVNSDLPPAVLYDRLVKPYFAARDRKIALINKSTIGPKQKKLIAAEAKYIAYNNVYELTWTNRQSKTNFDKLIIDIFDKTGVQPAVIPAGPQYYLFANDYAGYKEIKAYQQAKAANLKPNQLLPGYNITLTAAQAAAAKYGSNYMRWLSVNQFLPLAVAEQLGYQFIITAVSVKNTTLADVLATEFARKFPSSIYNPKIRKKVNSLKN